MLNTHNRKTDSRGRCQSSADALSALGCEATAMRSIIRYSSIIVQSRDRKEAFLRGPSTTAPQSSGRGPSVVQSRRLAGQFRPRHPRRPNIFKHPNFLLPNRYYNETSAGYLTDVQRASGKGGPRIMQFALRFEF